MLFSGYAAPQLTGCFLLKLPKFILPGALVTSGSSPSSESLYCAPFPESNAPYPVEMMRKGDCSVGLGPCCTLRYHFVSPFAAASRSEASIRFFSSGVWIIGEPGVEPGLELYVPLDMRCRLDEGCSGVPGLGDSDAPERCMNYVDHLSATFVLCSREANVKAYLHVRKTRRHGLRAGASLVRCRHGACVIAIVVKCNEFVQWKCESCRTMLSESLARINVSQKVGLTSATRCGIPPLVVDRLLACCLLASLHPHLFLHCSRHFT